MSTKITKIYDFKSNNKNELLQEVKENKQQYNKVGKYQIVTMTNEKWFRVSEKGRSFLPDVFANYFCSHYELYCCENKFYIYLNGYYRLITKNALLSLIEKEFRKFNYVDLKSNWTNETITRLEARQYISFEKFESRFNVNPDVINVKNGIIKFDFNSGNYEFLHHDKNNLSTIQLNVDFNKDNINLENWNNFLNTSLNTEKERMFLQEFMGYCLINHLSNNGQNIYCLHGEGGNGKGTVKRLLNSILGNRNICDSKARLLTDSDKQNQFFGFEFKDKLLLSATETNYNFKDLTLLKMLSGGDRQSTEIKGLSEKLDYDFKGKILLSTNDKIKIYDTSKGTKRRLKFIVMDNDIKKPISDLDNRLIREKESIFIWCLEGLQRLIKNDFIHTLPDSHFEVFERYMEHSNNYLKFIRNHIIIGGNIIKTDVFKLFNDQYGNIYKDKDELYSNFEKELKNLNIDFELKKIRNKSLFDNNNCNEKNTINYIGISYVEHKESKDIEQKECKCILDSIKNNIVSTINKTLDIPNLDILRNTIKEIFKDYDTTEIEEIINKKINQIKINRGITINETVEKNTKKIMSNIKALDDNGFKTLNTHNVFLDLNTNTLEDSAKIFFDNNKVFKPVFQNKEVNSFYNTYFQLLKDNWNIALNMSLEDVKKNIIEKQKES